MALERENLFSRGEREKLAAHAPLAVRLRPETLDNFVGQEHFAGEDKLLRRMIEAGNITSLIFYGPPGTGKTLLAKAVAREAEANFISMKSSDLLSKWYGESEQQIARLFQRARAVAPCILFIDEIDCLVPARGSGQGEPEVS